MRKQGNHWISLPIVQSTRDKTSLRLFLKIPQMAIHPHDRLGHHCWFELGAAVCEDQCPRMMAGGFSNEQINGIQEVYRYIYLRGFNDTEALEHIELELAPSAERDEIVNFIRNSERGIIKAPTSTSSDNGDD